MNYNDKNKEYLLKRFNILDLVLKFSNIITYISPQKLPRYFFLIRERARLKDHLKIQSIDF